MLRNDNFRLLLCLSLSLAFTPLLIAQMDLFLGHISLPVFIILETNEAASGFFMAHQNFVYLVAYFINTPMWNIGDWGRP